MFKSGTCTWYPHYVIFHYRPVSFPQQLLAMAVNALSYVLNSNHQNICRTSTAFYRYYTWVTPQDAYSVSKSATELKLSHI